jgi:hypothetical protein
MRVNRGPLYTGVFLLAIGGVIVAAELGAVDLGRLTDALRLWPLALIAIGAAIALRRTDVALPTGMLAAAIPGLIVGGAIAVAPTVTVDCVQHERSPGFASVYGDDDVPRVSWTRSNGDVHVTVDFGTVEKHRIGGCK